METHINKFCDYLIDQYTDAPIDKEAELIQKIRDEFPEIFFFPFLQHFLEYLLNKELIINSKYILKILINNHENINKKDYVTYQKGDIQISNDKYLIIGLILQVILKNNLTKSFNFIKQQSIDAKIPELQLNLFETIDKNRLIDLIYEDFELRSQNLLIKIKDDLS